MRKLAVLVALSGLFISCEPGNKKMASLIQENEKKLFADTLKQLDPVLATKQIALYQEFAEKYPDDTLAPTYLFKGSDLANGMGRGQDAVKMLETIQVQYPNYARAGAALFMQAFIFETSLHDNEKAIAKYSEFIKKYPDHNLTQAAQFSLLQLQQGLSPEEVVQMFESKNDSALKSNQ